MKIIKKGEIEDMKFTLHSATIKMSWYKRLENFEPVFTLHSATIKMLFCFI